MAGSSRALSVASHTRLPVSSTNPARLATRTELLASGAPNPTTRSAIKAHQRKMIVEALRIIAAPGVSLDMAITTLEIRFRNSALHPALQDAIALSIKGAQAFISRSTLYRWIELDRAGGKAALAPRHRGRVRAEGGWEAKAVELYSLPSKPSIAAVHRELCRVWAFDCSYEQVYGYLDALPSQAGKNSAARLGHNLYKQQQTAFTKRHTRNLKAGSIYMADGYRADVYLAHPMTGELWRPEIMHVIDLKSGYLVGYRIMAHEGGYDVMMGWAGIFERWNHVPPLLYIDNGSGYKNRLTELEGTSYYERAGVQAVVHSLPYNPRGKGHVERYHRIVRDDFLKLWQPQFYCGPDMAGDALNQTVRDVKAGRLTLPSLAQFIDAYEHWLATDYHQRLHPENKYATRAQEWAELDPIPPHATAMEMARPSERRKVQRASIQLMNRRYVHPDLHAWNGKSVLVEYDILDHRTIAVRTEDGRLICDAPLVEAIGVIGDSFLADKTQKALESAAGRLEKKLLEQKARAGMLIDVDAAVSGLVVEMEPPRQIGTTASDDDEIELFDL
ncbi:Mu transposase C-terminal domain-containing protein [Herbaspirillum sp.]|uniref:Mu transposase C-terminal domain-containing protein n=1 Tax=Herbaspirillum sp. TaxID=1890675 RepID=UPI001B271247|nr:Mu transposase C-terminal domain-containing protein [Herbaspirillum sp.]MBO9538749.1 Mu transposase C-terminal domain-containing protein [Herbaspirillum sp.]